MIEGLYGKHAAALYAQVMILKLMSFYVLYICVKIQCQQQGQQEQAQFLGFWESGGRERCDE